LAYRLFATPAPSKSKLGWSRSPTPWEPM